jgi:hypothetical protein
MNDITGEPGRSGQAADDCLTGERLVAVEHNHQLNLPESGRIDGEGRL